MPYANERASRLGHVDLAGNQAITDALQKYTVTLTDEKSLNDVAAQCVDIRTLSSPVDAGEIERTISIDGSNVEVQAMQDFPSINANFVQIAAVLTDIPTLREASEGPYVDPQLLRSAHATSRMDAVLPGSGLTLGRMSSKESWRHEVNEFFLDTPYDTGSNTTLADLLLLLYGTLDKPAVTVPVSLCPSCQAHFDEDAAPRVGKIRANDETSRCPSCNKALLLVDAIRISDEHSVLSANMLSTSRVMNIVERLMAVGYINDIAADGADALRAAMFFTDGPLAVFGPSATLHSRIGSFIDQISVRAGESPLIVGLEKTGAFAEHAQLVLERDLIKPGQVMMLTNSYINRVTGRTEGNRYGVNEFYGRRFLYCTTFGGVLVLTLRPKPGVEPYDGSPAAESFDSYPLLRVACEMLDALGTKLFENAVIPVALAHNASSLPLGVGRSVLTALAQKGLGLPSDHRTASVGF